MHFSLIVYNTFSIIILEKCLRKTNYPVTLLFEITFCFYSTEIGIHLFKCELLQTITNCIFKDSIIVLTTNLYYSAVEALFLQQIIKIYTVPRYFSLCSVKHFITLFHREKVWFRKINPRIHKIFI